MPSPGDVVIRIISTSPADRGIPSPLIGSIWELPIRVFNIVDGPLNTAYCLPIFFQTLHVDYKMARRTLRKLLAAPVPVVPV